MDPIAPLCLRAAIHEAAKPRADSEVPKYKAHCVYNGKQRVNRTLIETFSPAVRHTTVKASVRVLGAAEPPPSELRRDRRVPAGRVLRRRGGLRASAQGLRDVRRLRHHARLVDAHVDARRPVWPGRRGPDLVLHDPRAADG